MRWLLTGGAGYIGAHVAAELIASGREVVVFDDLSTGLAHRIPAGVTLIEADVKDAAAVERACHEESIDGVVHLAAKKAVEESVQQPLMYFHENVEGIVSLLAGMQQAGVHKIVYSSSAAVYGEPTTNSVSEVAPAIPTNPYGQTKLIGEWAVQDQAAATRLHGKQFSDVSLRYFNVAGAGSDVLGDTSVANLIPLALRAISSGTAPRINGDDYPTPDGTCVRDYVHVVDLARAHVAAAALCESDEQASRVFNVGRGFGSSVREVLDVVSEVTGFDGDIVVGPRRAGDPASLVALTSKVEAELGWKAELSLSDMVASAWSAWSAK